MDENKLAHRDLKLENILVKRNLKEKSFIKYQIMVQVNN